MSQIRPLIEVIRDAMVEALIATHGNRAEAAKALWMPRTTFYRKYIEFEIQESEYMPMLLKPPPPSVKRGRPRLIEEFRAA